jgi:hypothetical protein
MAFITSINSSSKSNVVRIAADFLTIIKNTIQKINSFVATIFNRIATQLGICNNSSALTFETNAKIENVEPNEVKIEEPNEAEIEKSQEVKQEEEETKQKEVSKKFNWKTAAVIGSTSILFTLAIAGVYLYLNKNSQQEKTGLVPYDKDSADTALVKYKSQNPSHSHPKSKRALLIEDGTGHPDFLSPRKNNPSNTTNTTTASNQEAIGSNLKKDSSTTIQQQCTQKIIRRETRYYQCPRGEKCFGKRKAIGAGSEKNSLITPTAKAPLLKGTKLPLAIGDGLENDSLTTTATAKTPLLEGTKPPLAIGDGSENDSLITRILNGIFSPSPKTNSDLYQQ